MLVPGMIGTREEPAYRLRIDDAHGSVAAPGHSMLYGARYWSCVDGFRNLDEDNVGAIFGEKTCYFFLGGHVHGIYSAAKCLCAPIEQLVRTFKDREGESLATHIEREHPSHLV
jgi:hypothetical protein